MQDHPWYMVVARPDGAPGDLNRPPRLEDMACFEVPHGSYVKLECGTWHAGPFFDGVGHLDFYNLELADTNVVDHNTHKYLQDAAPSRFVIEKP
jgi:hypothetical protein